MNNDKTKVTVQGKDKDKGKIPGEDENKNKAGAERLGDQKVKKKKDPRGGGQQRVFL
jgi:hypothetical protein